MPSFSTKLVPGGKPPYDTWTFVVVPGQIAETFGSKRTPVRGEINGVSFRGTLVRSRDVYRMPVPREFQKKAGIASGDRVEVYMEVDKAPRSIEIPLELAHVLDADPDLARSFDNLPPAHRRAWATHVADAKRTETRIRRAGKAVDGIRNKKFPGT
jgi:hypothetical protein